ncbi:MAG: hypothetical protein JXB04_11745 [Kiritimatiellae bacterium]|nr:hypothetical protein [Kiritimatiellia bacterium]
MIEGYSFGEIVIDGNRFNTDVLIFPDGHVDYSWWRKDGHLLTMEDIRELVTAQPEWIIAGTGEYGMVKLEPGLQKQLEQQGIKLEALPTAEAVKLYNDIRDSGSVGACLHITC